MFRLDTPPEILAAAHTIVFRAPTQPSNRRFNHGGEWADDMIRLEGMQLWKKMIVLAAMALQHVEWQIERGRSVPFDVIQRHRQLRPIAMAALTFEMLLASGDVAFLRQLRDTMPEDPLAVGRCRPPQGPRQLPRDPTDLLITAAAGVP